MNTAGGGAIASLSPDFQDFLTSLDEHRVDAVLIGGYALGAHGVIRATGDTDFLYRRSRKNVQRLVSALKEFGAPANVIDVAALMTPNVVTQFGSPPQRIDLLNAIDGVTFSGVWKGAVTIAIGGCKTRVIGLAELVSNKQAAGRQRDREDVRMLRARTP